MIILITNRHVRAPVNHYSSFESTWYWIKCQWLSLIIWLISHCKPLLVVESTVNPHFSQNHGHWSPLCHIMPWIPPWICPGVRLVDKLSGPRASNVIRIEVRGEARHPRWGEGGVPRGDLHQDDTHQRLRTVHAASWFMVVNHSWWWLTDGYLITHGWWSPAMVTCCGWQWLAVLKHCQCYGWRRWWLNHVTAGDVDPWARPAVTQV